VPNHFLVVGHVDPTQTERPARREPVGIVSDANACGERGYVSYFGRGMPESMKGGL